MDARRFDAYSRVLAATRSRRTLLASLAATLALAVHPTGETAAKKKNKKQKLKKNAFDCVNVGNKCRGKDNKCCSGICKGKKPKKGKKDKSKCQAHDESTCVAGRTIIACGGDLEVGCQTSAGLVGRCGTTTGNAGYCFREIQCADCKKDSDCASLCGEQAACVQCAGECTIFGLTTACAGPGFCFA